MREFKVFRPANEGKKTGSRRRPLNKGVAFLWKHFQVGAAHFDSRLMQMLGRNIISLPASQERLP